MDWRSEFQAEFELACQEKSVRLFVLPPPYPMRNEHVKRAQRTHTEELHDHYMGELALSQ
jgi:hypothetical protein